MDELYVGYILIGIALVLLFVVLLVDQFYLQPPLAPVQLSDLPPIPPVMMMVEVQFP